MSPVNQILRTAFESARSGLNSMEKGVERLEKRVERFEKRATTSVGKLEKIAKTSMDGVQARLTLTPKTFEGAWSEVVGKVRPVMIFATRAELLEVLAKVEELSAKVDRLAKRERKVAAA
jgi:chaperonin cofactor prefoldin